MPCKRHRVWQSDALPATRLAALARGRHALLDPAQHARRPHPLARSEATIAVDVELLDQRAAQALALRDPLRIALALLATTPLAHPITARCVDANVDIDIDVTGLGVDRAAGRVEAVSRGDRREGGQGDENQTGELHASQTLGCGLG